MISSLFSLLSLLLISLSALRTSHFELCIRPSTPLPTASTLCGTILGPNYCLLRPSHLDCDCLSLLASLCALPFSLPGPCCCCFGSCCCFCLLCCCFSRCFRCTSCLLCLCFFFLSCITLTLPPRTSCLLHLYAFPGGARTSTKAKTRTLCVLLVARVMSMRGEVPRRHI